jgi:hypothetical protein
MRNITQAGRNWYCPGRHRPATVFPLVSGPAFHRNYFMQQPSSIRKITFLGDYFPRKYGIATFTTDLRCAVAAKFPAMQCFVVPVNDCADGYDYPPEVRFEIAE